MLLDLNAVMSIIANVPAAIASTIVACRAVRRLTNYTTRGAEVFAYVTIVFQHPRQEIDHSLAFVARLKARPWRSTAAGAAGLAPACPSVTRNLTVFMSR